MERCVMSQGYGLVVDCTQHAPGLCSFLRNTTATVQNNRKTGNKGPLADTAACQLPHRPVACLSTNESSESFEECPLPMACAVRGKSRFFFFMRPKRQCSAIKDEGPCEETVEPPPSPATGMFTLGFKSVVGTTLCYSVYFSALDPSNSPKQSLLCLLFFNGSKFKELTSLPQWHFRGKAMILIPNCLTPRFLLTALP